MLRVVIDESCGPNGLFTFPAHAAINFPISFARFLLVFFILYLSHF